MAECETKAEAEEKWEWIEKHLLSNLRGEEGAGEERERGDRENGGIGDGTFCRIEMDESLDWMMSVLKGIFISNESGEKLYHRVP